MSRTVVPCFALSLDGFATGEGQSLEAPFGHAGRRLHEWMFATGFGRELFGETGGTRGLDDLLLRATRAGVGAEIMGAGKFGPPGWQDDPDWRGWWGEDPPFHMPTFVLTHRPRLALEMSGGTTFHFLDTTPEAALATAQQAAGDLDVQIGGGPTVVREFLIAGLIDELRLVVVPVVLGRGVRLWDGLEGLEEQYTVESVTSPSGVMHLSFARPARS